MISTQVDNFFVRPLKIFAFIFLLSFFAFFCKDWNVGCAAKCATHK